MDALQPSFMLLPDFTYLPDKDLQIGSILPSARNSKRPNPRQPLSASLPVAPDEISTQTFEPWTWDSGNSSSGGGGVFADLSIVTGIGAGIEGSRSYTAGLIIRSDRVVQSRFRPNSASIARAVADNTVSGIIKKLSRPSVYIVTGIMVAHGASIEVKKGKSHSGGAHASVNVTQVGVPVNTGIKGERSKSETSTLSHVPTSAFVLAYQLLRIRRKLDRSLDVVDENRWSLFNDNEDGEKTTESLLSEINIDQVTDKLELDDI